MAETPKIEFRTDYVKFGRNERHVPDILDKRQKNQNLANKKEEEPPKEDVKTSDFVDRSAQLGASLNSLALSNMIKLKRFEKTSKSKIDIFIDEKINFKSEMFNPFVQKD